MSNINNTYYKIYLIDSNKKMAAFSIFNYVNNKDSILNGFFMTLFNKKITVDIVNHNKDLFLNSSPFFLIDTINSYFIDCDFYFSIELSNSKKEYCQTEYSYNDIIKQLSYINGK